MRLFFSATTITLLIILIDIISARYISITFNKPKYLRKIIYVFSGLVVVSMLILFLGGILNQNNTDTFPYHLIFNLFATFMLLYFPRLIFIIWGIFYDLLRIFIRKKFPIYFLRMGFGLSIILFFIFLHGIFLGKNKIETKYINVEHSLIPKSFDNIKIIQISDWHLGSYGNNTQHVSDIIDSINGINPDVIVFTGDMVNNFAKETIAFIEPFKKLKKAKYGNYAILGNHDYSDYSTWLNDTLKTNNQNQLLGFLHLAGFKLLLNENIPIVKNDDTLFIAGVENWGLPPFKQYGNLEKSLQGINSNNPVIVLSHDPSHFEEEIIDYKNIFLTLSGHTHAMQMGFTWNDFSWTPASFRYKYTNGLYLQKSQFLYVNKGLGTIALNLRIGMYPEISIISLKYSNV